MEGVRLTVEDGVATITLDRPKVNALSRSMLAALGGALQRVAADDAVRGVLVRAEGRCFSAGLDLREVATLDRSAAGPFLADFDATFAGLYRLEKPLAVAVEGHAVAGGMVIALAADFLALPKGRPDVRLGLSELAVGVPFPRVAFEIVANGLPPRALRALVYGAGTHDPAAAFELGAGDALAEDPTAEARRWLATITSRPARTFQLAKRSIRGDSWARIDRLALPEYGDFVDAITSPEALRAMAATLAK